MKPFDLERALAGDKVITKAGREVRQILYFDKINLTYPVIACIEVNDILSFTKEGVFAINGHGSHGDSWNDLFMAPIKKTYWVNLYEFEGYKIDTTTGDTFESFEKAQEEIKRNAVKLIKTISFEIEI